MPKQRVLPRSFSQRDKTGTAIDVFALHRPDGVNAVFLHGLGKIPIDSGGATIFECLPESVLLNADVAKNVFDRGKIATSDCGAKVLRSYQFRPSQNPPAKRSPAAINPPPMQAQISRPHTPLSLSLKSMVAALNAL